MDFSALLSGVGNAMQASAPGGVAPQEDQLALLLKSILGGQSQAAPGAGPVPVTPGTAAPAAAPLQAPVPQALAQDEADGGQPITVAAPSKVPSQTSPGSADDTMPVRGLGNASMVADAAEANKNSQAAGGHRGLFGTKGTLRDILGTLGDGFLVNSGNKAVYAPMREREKAGDALTGFQQNPEAAATRLAQGGQPELALKVMQEANATAIKQAAAQQAAQVARQKQLALGLPAVASLMGSVKSQAEYDARKKLFGTLNDTYSLGIDIPDKYEDARAMIDRTMGMKPGEQDRSEQGKARIAETGRHNQATEGIGQQNAAANTKRANRPPAGRAPQKRTMSDVQASVADAVLAGKATPAQQKYYDDNMTGRGKRSGGARAALGASTAGGAVTGTGKYVEKGGVRYEVMSNGKGRKVN